MWVCLCGEEDLRRAPIYLCYVHVTRRNIGGPSLLSIHIKRCVTERNFLLDNKLNVIDPAWAFSKPTKVMAGNNVNLYMDGKFPSQIKLIMIMVRLLRSKKSG